VREYYERRRADVPAELVAGIGGDVIHAGRWFVAVLA
jgi:hypothetical protein